MLIARLFYMSAMGFQPSKSQGMGDASKLQARGDARLKAEKLYWPAFGAKQLDKPRFEIADPKRHSVFDTVGTACFEYALPQTETLSVPLKKFLDVVHHRSRPLSVNYDPHLRQSRE